MTIRVELIVTGPDLVVKDLVEFGDRARDARPAMKSVLTQMVIAERDQFATSGGHVGGAWPADRQITIDRKQAAGQDLRTERRTGAVEKALTGDRGKGRIRRTGKQSATYGTSILYARFQRRYGRPLLQFALRDFRAWEDTIAGWLMEGKA